MRVVWLEFINVIFLPWRWRQPHPPECLYLQQTAWHHIPWNHNLNIHHSKDLKSVTNATILLHGSLYWWRMQQLWFWTCAGFQNISKNETAGHYIPKTIILLVLISHNIPIILTLTRIVALYQPVATAPPTKKIKVNNAGEAQSVYYCHLCGFEYIVKFNLQKHLERQHKEEERNEVPEWVNDYSYNIIRVLVC